jgi:integrase
MSSISQFEWQEFINSYNSRGRHRTARKLYQLLSACYDFAVGDEVLVKNPFLKVKLGEYEKKHGDPLTLEEEKALVAALLEFGDLYSQAFVFLVYTGLRRSELASVSVADGWVYVKTSKVRKGRAEKPRCLPVSPMLSALLSHIDVQAIKEINPNVLTKNFKKRFPAHHLHDTRHTFITRCQECGIQRELVSLWAGHAPDSSITSTVYTHLEKNKQHQVEEMSKFSYTL